MAASGVEELVGRERELEELQAFLDAASLGPRALLLEGEPGIGKTTLWQSGLGMAQSLGFEVLTARPAEPEALLSFAALGDLVAPVVDSIGALPEPQRRALRVALLLEEHAGVAVDSRAVSVALLGLLHRLAHERPVLVAVDDVQWLDPATARALAFALRRVESIPIGFLGTARPRQDRLSIEGLEAMPLGPLDPLAIDRIVGRALASPLARPTRRQLGQASGGNPFYALELARSVEQDSGEVARAGLVAVPPGLGELLSARLTVLPLSARRALGAVAALAQPTHELVAQAVGEDAAALRAARDAGVVAFEERVIRFTHPLLASAAYGEIPSEDRRDLHRRLATVVGDPEERARHLALAVDPPDLEVAAALEAAADSAFERGAIEAAADLMEQALRFSSGTSGEILARRRIAAAGYLARTGAKTRGRALLAEAEADAPVGPARARIALTGTWFGLWEPSFCIKALRTALCDAGDDRLLLTRIHSALAHMLLYVPDLSAAERHAGTALQLAEELGDSAHLVVALTGSVQVAFFAGRGLDREKIDRAVALEAAAGNPYGNVGVARGCLGSTLAVLAELDAARMILEEKAAEERRRADIGIAWTLSELARVEIRAGKWKRAEALAEESAAVAREAADVQQEALAHRRLFAVAVLYGDVERARRLRAEGLRLADLGQTPLSRAEIEAYSGLLELSLGDAAAAVAHLENVARFVEAAGFGDPDIVPFGPDYVEALIASGELEHAERETAALEAQARRLDRASTLAAAARCRGQLAAAQGELPAAVEILAAACAAAAEVPLPFEFARTVLAQGIAQRRAKQVVEARRALEEALATFATLGASSWEEVARRELARLGGRRAQTKDLTSTEREIAELVAAGKTNQQVARALHLSPKTVEWNLSKIYRKLRVSSRTELAAKLARTVRS